MREFDAAADDSVRYVVCSHSCDIAALAGPLLFVARGSIAEHDGNRTGAKSIDFLQVRSLSGRIVHYSIERLRLIDASILDRHAPWADEGYSDDDLNSLSVWLGQRFRRLALSDDVANALKTSGIEEALHEKLKRAASEILDVRVRLDETANPPSIAFLILFDSGSADGEKSATRIAEVIMRRAERRANDLDGKLTVETAVAIADTALTYAQLRQTHRYRFEHVSLRTAPPATLPAD